LTLVVKKIDFPRNINPGRFLMADFPRKRILSKIDQLIISVVYFRRANMANRLIIGSKADDS
jgi:hypothetical protein